MYQQYFYFEIRSLFNCSCKYYIKLVRKKLFAKNQKFVVFCQGVSELSITFPYLGNLLVTQCHLDMIYVHS